MSFIGQNPFFSIACAYAELKANYELLQGRLAYPNWNFSLSSEQEALEVSAEGGEVAEALGKGRRKRSQTALARSPSLQVINHQASCMTSMTPIESV